MPFDPTAKTIPADGPPAPADRPPGPVLADGPADPRAELDRLLASRLRQAFALFLFGYLLFVARDASVPGRSWQDVQLRLLALAVAAQLAVIAVGRGRAFARRPVRHAIEWANLGVYAVAAGGAQYTSLVNPADTARLLAGGSDDQILVANTWVLPWFAVIAGYPVLVPNPWRRTAGIVAAAALVPVGVTAAAMAGNPALTWDRAGWMFAQFVIWGSVGGWVAVYGAT